MGSSWREARGHRAAVATAAGMVTGVATGSAPAHDAGVRSKEEEEASPSDHRHSSSDGADH